jgi:3-oxoacyl-[acyl-carrier protein] reductase
VAASTEFKVSSMPVGETSLKVCLVTGSTQGIGLAIARRFAGQGYAVVLNGRRGDALERAADACAATASDVLCCAGDVSNEEDVLRMFDAIGQRFGRLDVAVSNAGISPRLDGRKPDVDETPLEFWNQTLAINLTGTFLVCRSAVRLMKPRRFGRIINMASQAARMQTGFGSSYYAASKAGIVGFSRVLAGEVGPHGITVNCVSPGRIATEMSNTYSNPEAITRAYAQRTPVGRVGTADEVAAAVAYLASDEAGFTTGAVLDVTGGFFMP